MRPELGNQGFAYHPSIEYSDRSTRALRQRRPFEGDADLLYRRSVDPGGAGRELDVYLFGGSTTFGWDTQMRGQSAPISGPLCNRRPGRDRASRRP